jgi:hypothetical protein
MSLSLRAEGGDNIYALFMMTKTRVECGLTF